MIGRYGTEGGLMPGYPSLLEIMTTIGWIAFFFLLGIVILAGLCWMLKKC